MSLDILKLEIKWNKQRLNKLWGGYRNTSKTTL